MTRRNMQRHAGSRINYSRARKPRRVDAVEEWERGWAGGAQTWMVIAFLFVSSWLPA